MRGRNPWTRKLGALVMALALCVGLLPGTALATGENSWEHTSHDSGWTALTADKLTELDYTLSNGKYYLSGTADEWGESYILETTQQLTITGTVALCLNNTRYTYEGSSDAAIVISEGADLIICCCQSDEWGNYDGMVSNSNVSYGIYNAGTLTVTGGGIFINQENGAAIYNAGTCTISGGSMNGTAGWWENYKTAYGIFNANGAKLTISGSPSISGTAPGDMNDPSGPQIDILTYDMIYVDDLDTSSFENYKSYNIGYYGTPGEAVVSGVAGVLDPSWENENEYLAATWMRFQLTYPENAEFIYTPPEGSNPGTLTYAGHTSLTYGDTNVMDNTYYKVNESGSGLEKGTEADYDILWDEDGKTLTLNHVTIKEQIENFTYADSLFSAAVEEGITIELIGENSIMVSSHAHGVDRDAYAIKNEAGGITLQGEGSLAITMRRGSTSGEQDIVGIQAAGTVNNKTALSISGDKGALDTWPGMTGIVCDSFNNTGTFAAKISDASTACALYTGNFANSGDLDVDFTGVGNGVGVQLIGGTSFENSGKIDIAIPDADSARGIGRYSTSGTQVDNDFSWTNTESGVITIDVSGEGDATAALGGQTLAGMDLRSGEDITFTNHGTITATAISDGPANLTETNWPSWQYFDTLGILLLCDEGTFTNTGDMKLTALNGYTAGISIGGTNDYDISITNSGNLNITTTTKGGDNIRSVGIYAQIPGIKSGTARELPFNTTGGTVSISTSAVDGSTVDSGKLMAICLVQTFTAGTTVPSDTGAFQQITGEGMALSGQPVVLKVENDGKNQTAFINTIGTVSEDGTVTPTTDMTVVPSITGTVTIQGTPQVGSTLTAQVSGLPDGVSVTYQWQAADSAEGPFTNIQGTTESTYTPTNDQVGQYLRVVVKPVGEAYGGALTATTTQAVVKPYIPPANPNYKITVEATQGGTVVVTPTSAKAGTTVTLTPVPDQGFALDTLAVTDRFGNPVSLTERANGTYTFVMPNGQVTVTATFTETAPEPLPFTDVAEGDWFYDAVRYAYENGLMDGVGGNRFAPNSETTRAQLVTILYRLEGQPAVSGDLPFTDVEAGTWYTNAILWAAQNGIVNGVNDTEFAPGDEITRQQLVTILYRYAEAKVCDVSASADLSGYPDAGQVQGYAQPAMAWAVAEGIVEGMDGNLNPAGNASRAQIATILMRFCEDAAQ